MDFHFGSFEPSVTKNDSVAELGNENIYFCPVQASSACNVEIGWNSTGWVSIPANVTPWHRLLRKSICTTEASDYWLGAEYSVIYVLLPMNKII